jgi:Secretion system C-terminal sorting domain
MKLYILIVLCAVYSHAAYSNVYFPLHVGDSWYYDDHTSLLCEGTQIIVPIIQDTLINGQRYALFHLPAFHSPFVRADSLRVYEFDTTSQSEIAVFDFSAQPGDTVSVRNQGSTVTIALGNLMFAVNNAIYTIQDSLGVVAWHPDPPTCNFQLVYAWIDGKQVSTGISSNTMQIPDRVYLEQNFPNPFNFTTTIRFSLPSETFVTIRIFDLAGRSVQVLLNNNLRAGWHTVVWNALNQSSGVYFCRLETAQSVFTRSIVLLK